MRLRRSRSPRSKRLSIQGATSGHRTTSSDPPRIGCPSKICACPSMASVQNCSLLQKDNSRPTGFGALRLLRAAHLREGDYRPRPHQLRDRCPCQKQKPGGDHDSNIGDEPNQDRIQRVAHANPPTIVASCFTVGYTRAESMEKARDIKPRLPQRRKTSSCKSSASGALRKVA